MIQGLGQAFGMDASKAEALIRRLVTGKAVSSKPMAQAGAQRAADRLRGLGLTVTLKPAEAAVPVTPPTPPVEAPFVPPARSGSAAVLEAPPAAAVRESAVRAPVDVTHQSVILAPDEAPADAWSSSAPSAWPASTPDAWTASNPALNAAADVPPASAEIPTRASGVHSDWPAAPAADPWADSTPDPWTASAPAAEEPTPDLNANRNPAGTGPWLAREPEPAAPDPVWEADAPVEKARPSGRRVSLRTKFLGAAVLPTVLAVAAAVLAIFLTVPGALRTLLLESARNPATAMADGIAAFVTTDQLSAKDAQQLQGQLDASRLDYQAKNVAFLLVTDASGNPLAGWYKNEPKLASMPSDIGTYVQTQARRAVAEHFMKTNNYPAGTANPPSRLVDAGGQSLEVAAQPIARAGAALGTVIVGMTSQTVENRVLSTITGTLLASVLPILLAFLLAAGLARSITQGVVALVRSADRISLGDFEAPIEVRANDELRELGEALERMRTSLQESLERLRRRRH